MILPTKHIPISQSLLGVGIFLISYLDQPKTVSDLWEQVRNYTQIGSFYRFTLTLSFLYTLGLIDYENGLLKRVHL